MSGLRHDRPVFKVMKAGGGERVRTIAEELRSVHPPEADVLRSPGRRCGSCDSRDRVGGELSPRCETCRHVEECERQARRATRVPVSRAPRSRVCTNCRVELPATGVCGFCA